jgi:hypothetical protein
MEASMTLDIGCYVLCPDRDEMTIKGGPVRCNDTRDNQVPSSSSGICRRFSSDNNSWLPE